MLIISLLLSSGLLACGYPTPQNGGSLTPFVTIVTPTPLSATATAYADATVLARITPTPLPLTFTAPTLPPTKVGQPPGSTAPQQAAPTPQVALQGDEYTVQSGDTLLGIAIRFNVDFEELATSNNIIDRNNLKIGQKLTIPKRKIGTPSAATNP